MNNQQQVRHILVIEDDKGIQTIYLQDSSYSIGRHSSNSIVVNSKLISRHHATLLRVKYENQDDKFWLIDGDLEGNRSTNGMLVNGKRYLSHEFKTGDIVLLAGEVKVNYYKVNNDAHKYLLKEKKKNQQPKKENKKKLLSSNEMQTTIVSYENIFDEVSQDFFSQLSYFPELLPQAIVEIDHQGQITYVNQIAQEKFPEIYQKELQHPLLEGLLDNTNNRLGKLLIRELKIQDKIFEQYSHYLLDRPLIRSYVFDLTKRKQVETALRESEQRYKALIKQISEGIFLIDLENKQIIEANNAYCQLLNYTPEEILQLTIYDIVALDREIIDNHLQKIVLGKVNLIMESVHRQKNNSLIQVEVSVTLVSYGGKEILCFAVRDITERKRTEELLKYQAYHDLLTGLPNRNLFHQHLDQALTKAKQNKTKFAVMFIDLDHFKKINDGLGHAMGDKLLQNFAQRIVSNLDSSIILARWGGDEFTLLVPEISIENDVVRISEQILEIINLPFDIEGNQLYVRLSIGIAIYPQDGIDEETLVKNADAVLYQIKTQGRNSYKFYNPMINSQTSGLLKLENLLYQALEKKQLFLVYQPQINVNTLTITGMEVLLRWQHPERGIISPCEFIPLAEETGLIVPIGQWVLETACTQNKAWQDSGFPPLTIAVNLSPRQFQAGNLPHLVETVLHKTNLSPDCLELEITENMIIQNIDLAHQYLCNLSQLGVQIALDDFGTGYSSLGYLKKFPFHSIKIDQSFVRDLNPHNPKDKAVVAAVIALGQGFNIKVIAEGVETVEQMQLLKDLQCYEMQGYLFSRPLNLSDATTFLERNCQDFTTIKNVVL